MKTTRIQVRFSKKKIKKKKNRGLDFRKQTEYAKNTVFCV